LQKKYAGSKIVEDGLVILIPVSDGEVSLNIGGCSQYGVDIELKTTAGEKYILEESIKLTTIDLMEKYSNGVVNVARLKKSISESWRKLGINSYVVKYGGEGDTFLVSKSVEGKYTIISVSYQRYL